MRKKVIIIGLTSAFIIISGFCYSCAYNSKDSAVLVSSGTSGINQSEEKMPATTTSSDLSTPDSTTTGTSATDKQKDVLESASSGTTADSLSMDTQKNYIFVHICGAVINPGVYPAKEEARIVDLIKLAGGLTKGAAGDYINQAQLVTDGQRIYIPNQEELKELSTADYIAGEQKDTASTNTEGGEESALININTADKEELMSISGIGEVKATSIIAYREKNGKFNAIEELMNIPGIKEGLFSQISYMIVAN